MSLSVYCDETETRVLVCVRNEVMFLETFLRPLVSLSVYCDETETRVWGSCWK